MGRFPHSGWSVSGWVTSGPGVALLMLIGLVFVTLLVLAVRRARTAGKRARVPVVEVLDGDQEFIVVVELPGVSQEEIRLDAGNDVLHLETSGERQYVTTEVLPEPVQGTTLRTEFKNGLLTIHLVKEGCDLEGGPVARGVPATA